MLKSENNKASGWWERPRFEGAILRRTWESWFIFKLFQQSEYCFSGLDKNRSLNCAGPPAAIPSRPCRFKSSYFFPQLLPRPGRNRLCAGLSPVVFTLSQEQASGASSGCGVLQRTATAAVGGGCPGSEPAAATALEPRPPWPPACPL
jgi:hypothetical protein